MNTSVQKDSLTPPRLFASLQAGFNLTTNHIYLILFPVVLDFLLWLGPHVRIKDLSQPAFNTWIASVNSAGASDLQAFINSNQVIFQTLLEQFNLLSILRTFPIGIPSLLSTGTGLSTPFGSALLVEIPSFTVFFLSFFGLLGIGLIFGSFFFTQVAQATGEASTGTKPAVVISHVIQTFLLSFTLLMVLVLISIPSLIFLTVLGMITPGLAQFGGLIVMVFAIWLLLPLAFSPHGIFAGGLTAFSSFYNSVRLIRLFLPGTGMFIIVSLVVNEGMNLIWHIPETASWMTAIAIFGHGFIATSLLAASFAYFRSGMKWMNGNLAKQAKIGSQSA